MPFLTFSDAAKATGAEIHNKAQSPGNTQQIDSKTAMRRRQFATRRESSIGAMVMTNKFDDNDIRRKFRNYEI